MPCPPSVSAPPAKGGRALPAAGARGRGGRWRVVPVALTFALALAAGRAGPLAGQQEVEEAAPPSYLSELELSTQTRQSLRRLAELWDQWIGAYYQADDERSAALVEQLLATSQELGLPRLPDLAFAAQMQALEAAREGDFARARRGLEVASRLDPERPESDFAAARILWLRGNYPVSLFHSVRGLLGLLRLPTERRLLAIDTAVWALAVLLLTGALFVALQMAGKGGGLIRDLVRLLARFVPRWLAFPLSVVLLLWPLLLPYGPLWLILYWSVLLWGYGAPSERTVLILLWVLLGVAPFLLAEARQQVWRELSPPVQALHQVRAGRLYGSLFQDLEVLRSMLPESTAVQHFIADLHRTLGHWDSARALYDQVLREDPNQPSALLNLGAYYFFTGDFGSSIDYFKRAAELNPRDPMALYNLGQAYNEQYFFDEGQQALAAARLLDNSRVNQWLRRTGRDRIVTPLGGFARGGEIRRSLEAEWAAAQSPASRVELMRRGVSLLAAVALVVIAVLLHLARRPFGYTDPPLDLTLDRSLSERLLRALLPGLEAAEVGEGGLAFLALLVPAALLMLPLGRTLVFTLPLGFDPGSSLAWTVAVLGLLAFFGVRFAGELRRGG